MVEMKKIPIFVPGDYCKDYAGCLGIVRRVENGEVYCCQKKDDEKHAWLCIYPEHITEEEYNEGLLELHNERSD